MSTGAGLAGQGSGGLPSLTAAMGVESGPAGVTADVAVGTTGAPGAPQAPGAPAAAPGSGFDFNAVAAKGRWFGPILGIGGGIAALAAFKGGAGGSAFLKFGGTTAALGGLGLTGVGFRAHGIQLGTRATEAQAVLAINQLSQQYEAAMASLTTQANAEIAAAQQQAAAAGGTPGTGGTGIDPATGQPVPGASPQGGGAGVGLGGTVVPGAGQQGGSATGGTGQSPAAPTAGTPAPAVGTPSAAGTPAGQPVTPAATGPWSVQTLVGRSVQLAAGTTATGAVIAEPGSWRIEQPAGDPGGYATLEEANAAARSTMSTELMGSKFLRWMVVEHGGRFYGAVAKQLDTTEQAPPLDAATGTVVAWSAMNHVTENGQSGWQAYTWTKPGGATAIAVPYGTTSVFPGVAVGVTGGGGPAAGAAPTGSAPATGAAPVAATGAAAAARFDPASQVGRSFAVNASATEDGTVVRGGALQLQSFVTSSSGGFGTPEEAAVAPPPAPAQAGGSNQWSRWVTLQGGDGRYYVFQGSIVKRETAALSGAAPMHVFGPGFASFYDGASSSWRALGDVA